MLLSLSWHSRHNSFHPIRRFFSLPFFSLKIHSLAMFCIHFTWLRLAESGSCVESTLIILVNPRTFHVLPFLFSLWLHFLFVPYNLSMCYIVKPFSDNFLSFDCFLIFPLNFHFRSFSLISTVCLIPCISSQRLFGVICSFHNFFSTIHLIASYSMFYPYSHFWRYM